MNYFFYVKDFVDEVFKDNKNKGEIDSEKVCDDFSKNLQKVPNEEFENLLIVSGFIPDLYDKDSSEETLYTKLTEALVGNWAERIGASAELIKQKASYEDIKISLNDKTVVCDAKSFRLGRSQQAPNAKDFLKLEDIRKWMDRYQNAIGGLVTYPCKHEWTGRSDVYQYCSTKEVPTVMLPYKYLAFLLHTKMMYTTKDFASLWDDYGEIFPEKLTKKANDPNKVKYWSEIDKKICEITKSTPENLKSYVNSANKVIDNCIKEYLIYLDKYKEDIEKQIRKSIDGVTDIDELKSRLIASEVNQKTKPLNQIIQHIHHFR